MQLSDIEPADVAADRFERADCLINGDPEQAGEDANQQAQRNQQSAGDLREHHGAICGRIGDLNRRLAAYKRINVPIFIEPVQPVEAGALARQIDFWAGRVAQHALLVPDLGRVLGKVLGRRACSPGT